MLWLVCLANLLKSDAWFCFFLFHCARCKGNCYVTVAGKWSISGLIVGALVGSVLTFRFVGTSGWTCEKANVMIRMQVMDSDSLFTSKWQGTCPNVARKIAGKKASLEQNWVKMFEKFEEIIIYILNFKKLVEFIFCLPGTSAPVKRFFSTMSNICSDNRSKMLEQNVKALMACRCDTDFPAVIFTRKQNRTKTSWKKYCLQKIMIGQMWKLQMFENCFVF